MFPVHYTSQKTAWGALNMCRMICAPRFPTTVFTEPSSTELEGRWQPAWHHAPESLGPQASRALHVGFMTGKLRHLSREPRCTFAVVHYNVSDMQKFISTTTCVTAVPASSTDSISGWGICKWDPPPPPARVWWGALHPSVSVLHVGAWTSPHPFIMIFFFLFSYWHWLVLGHADSDELNS